MPEPIIDGQLSLTDPQNDPIVSSASMKQQSGLSEHRAFSAEPKIDVGERVFDFGQTIQLDDFQVVRREFYAHIREPSITFNNYCFSVNTACIARFPKADYVQILVDGNKKLVALRPCAEGTRDSYQWCSYSKGKRKPRSIAGKIFYAKVIDLMGWNPYNRYKVLGWLVRANEEYLLVFDLTSKETYQRTFIEGEKPRTSRTAVFSEDWQNSFGLPYGEHKRRMQVNVFDGFAIYTVAVPSEKKISDASDNTQLTPQLSEGGKPNG